MALVLLTSAAGSPGVTTTAVGLARCWPGDTLLVDADRQPHRGRLRRRRCHGQVSQLGGIRRPHRRLHDAALSNHRNTSCLASGSELDDQLSILAIDFDPGLLNFNLFLPLFW